MDTLTFITQLIESLAWPLTVLTVFLLLRKEIVGSIPRLQRLKFKDAELEFQQKARELENTLPMMPEDLPLVSEVEQKLKYLARMSPRLAIIEAWSQIEFSLGQYAAAQKLVTAGEKIRDNIAYAAGGALAMTDSARRSPQPGFLRHHDLR